MSTPSAHARGCFIGEITAVSGGPAVRDPLRASGPVKLAPGQPVLADGAVVRVARVTPEGAELDGPPLAQPGSARAALYRIAWEHGLDPVYPEAVEREVSEWLASPGLDDPSLVDLTHLPFVTIDGPSSRDLDQALYVAREGAGLCAYYALADASYYVRPGSALFAEALRRGASYYLPGLTVPMLPRALCEGLVSLNPEVPRRSLTFAMHLDERGQVRSTEMVRARVRSRAKLSFGEVQSFIDQPQGSPLSGRDFAESLGLFRELGLLRLRDAVERGVVRYRREEVDVALDGEEGLEFVVLASLRLEVELWNEQLSLLCNREGARLLRESPKSWVQPIYRVHPSPAPERLRQLGQHLDALARARKLDPSVWCWDADRDRRSLAEFLAQLPAEGPLARVAAAVQRQAIVINVRSGYAPEPGPHHGVGAEEYARFSAPMREIVGVFVHKEAIELLAGRSSFTDEADVATRQQVVESANRAKETQRKVTDLANRLVLDRLFARDMALAPEARPVRAATVMGFSGRKVHVQLDEPPIDVKLYQEDLERRWGCRLALDPASVALSDAATGEQRLCEGDRVDLRVEGQDAARDRWVLVPTSPRSEA